MKLVSWNIDGAFSPSRDSPAIVASALERVGPDIVTLQEVHKRSVEPLCGALADLGLMHYVYSRADNSEQSHGVLIASRHSVTEAERAWVALAPRPEFVAAAIVHIDGIPTEVLSAHIPNGSSNGWIKIRCFEVLGHRLRSAADAPRILTGDFNEPRQIRPSKQIVTWGQVVLDNGGVHSEGNMTSGEKEKRGTDRRVRWDQGVRDVLAGKTSHGLRHAWLEGHIPDPMPTTWKQKRKGRGSGFYDHVFVSRHFDIEDAGFFHEWREDRLSDHSGAWVRLRLGETPVNVAAPSR